MAPKRKSNEKGGGSYNSSQFVSAAVAERYEKTLNIVVRNCIPEQGLEFGEFNIPIVVGYIESRGWSDFCKEPLAAVDCVVRKFYANAFEQKNRKTIIRGRIMKFDPSTINTFYGLPEVDDSAYRALKGEANYEKLIAVLSNSGSGAKWRMHNGEYQSFPSKYLTVGFRVWHYFMLARLMPSTYISDMSKERAILLYAISNSLRLNVGFIIYSSIVHSLKLANAGFSFPLLITALCNSAGVRYASREKLIQPKPILNPHFYHLLTSGRQNAEPRRDKAPTALPTSLTSQRLTTKERMGRVEESVSDIRQTLDDQWQFMRHQHDWFGQQATYQSAYLECLGQMSHMQVSSLGTDLTQFLPFPTYPGSKFAYSSGAPIEEHYGGGEEMNE